MGKIYEQRISQFNGGISGDVDSPLLTRANLIKHFDIHQSPYRLVQNRSTENDMHDGSSATGMQQYNLLNFAVGSDGKLYGIGHQVDGGNTTKSWIFYKAAPTTASWTVNNDYKSTLAGGASWQDCFIEWQSSFYSFGTGYVIRCPLSGTFVDNVVAVTGTITSVAQGVVGADGNLYLFYNNKIIRVNSSGTATDNVCTALPSDMMITSVCTYGSYLAIGMATKTSTNTVDTTKPSRVFIWDYVTAATVQEKIDFGEGALMVLGNIEGNLVGIMDKNLSTSAGVTLGLGKGSMVVKVWNGGIPETVKEIVGTQSVTLGRMLKYKAVRENKLYWVASVPYGTSTSTESTYHMGIWCFGRKDSSSPFVLSLDFIEDGTSTSYWYLNAFASIGNYFYINHSNDGSITRTDDAANYTTYSVWESQKYGDAKQKKLVYVAVETEALPTDATVTLAYKVNGGSSFRNIFINGTDSSLRHEAINLEPIVATMTQASPCVVTAATSHGLSAGDKFYFSTTGALLTGITAGTYYYVIATGLTSTQFQFSATSGGSAINTTGTQSGVHSINFESGLGLFRQIEFQVQSYGGAVVKAIVWRWEEIDDSIA